MRNDTSAEGYILMAASIFACNHIVNCKLHCHEIEKSYLLPVRACRADRACGFGDVRLLRRRRGFRRSGRRFSVARDSGRTDRSGSHSRRKRRIYLYGKQPADRRRAACGADDLSPGTCLGEYLLCRGGYPDRTVGAGRRDRVSGRWHCPIRTWRSGSPASSPRGPGSPDGKRIWSKESREPAFIA